VDKPADLDVAMVMGMGFPAFRGGLVFWADLMGAGAPRSNDSGIPGTLGLKRLMAFKTSSCPT